MGVGMFTVLIVAIIALIVGICSSIASFIWIIYALIALAVIAFNIHLWVDNDYEKVSFTIGSILGLIVFAIFCAIIAAIGS